MTPQLMALTSGDNLHIIGVQEPRAIYLRQMASNMKSGGECAAALDTVLRA
jgi:hypothetical protein